jgi:hypothetical protein
MVGGTQTSFSRVQAEQGQVFVVAASHLIFRFLQPLHARMTGRGIQQGEENHQKEALTLEPFVSIVLINENIV